MAIIPVLIVILCALSGFSIALFIHSKKKKSEPLVCPIGHFCDPVVHSNYSKFMNIPVEILGMLYYVLVLLCYSSLFMFPGLRTEWLVLTLLAMSGLALLFSIYLTYVQAFVLKEWCTWCLCSATLCAVIFFTALYLSGMEVLPLLVGEFIEN